MPVVALLELRLWKHSSNSHTGKKHSPDIFSRNGRVQCKGHTHKGHRQKVLRATSFRVFSRYFQVVFRIFSGYFQGVFQGVSERFQGWFPYAYALFGYALPQYLGANKNKRRIKHRNTIFTGLSQDFCFGFCLCVFLHHVEWPKKNINKFLPPTQSRDNPANLFMFICVLSFPECRTRWGH